MRAASRLHHHVRPPHTWTFTRPSAAIPTATYGRGRREGEKKRKRREREGFGERGRKRERRWRTTGERAGIGWDRDRFDEESERARAALRSPIPGTLRSKESSVLSATMVTKRTGRKPHAASLPRSTLSVCPFVHSFGRPSVRLCSPSIEKRARLRLD